MKKTLSLVIFCFCFLYMTSVSTFAIQVDLDTENIPEDVKTKLTSIYYQSKSAMTGREIGLFFEPELIGTNNFGPEIMGGLFSDGSFVLTGNGDMTYRPSDIYDDFITSVYVDRGINSLYDESFKDCSALEYVYIMGTVSDMGDYTFADCPALHTIVIENGVTGIGQYTFNNCTGIQNLKLPSSLSLTTTGFNNCTSLVTAGPMNGSYIVEVDWDGTIPDNAFTGMYYIQEITIPEGVTDIGAYAFGDCTNLSLVCIPKSVKSIGSVAFCNMQENSWVYYAGNQTEWNKIAVSEGNEQLKNAYFYHNTVPYVSVNKGHNYKPEISWPEVPFAIGYEVFYALDSGTYYEYLTSVAYPSTSVTHTTALTGETYHYVVRALMPENRYADFSSPVSFTVPSNVPVLSVQLSSKNYPVLSWNTIDGFEKYRIYRSEGDSEDYSLIVTTSYNSFTNTSIKPGTTYNYKIQTYSDVGIGGPFSEIVTITIPEKKVAGPEATGKLSTAGKPYISWTAVTNISKYVIERSETATFETVKVLSTTTYRSLTNSKDIAAGKTYYYRVKALLTDGTYSEYSNVVSVTMPAPEAEKVAGPEVTGKLSTAGKPYISWTAVTNTSKYVIERSETATFETVKVLSTTTYRSLTNSKDIAAGKTYYYRVKALLTDGTYSEYSNVVSVTMPAQ